MKNRAVEIISRGALGGLGFGLAVGIVHFAIGIALIISMGQPPMTWFAAKTILMEVPLAVIIGIILSPLHLLNRARYIQPAIMAVLWILMERYVAIDPSKLQMWVAPSIVALVFFYFFQWVANKKMWIVVAVSIATPVILLIVPVVNYHVRGGYEVETQTTEAVDRAPENAPDVVVVVLDTVRARSVSAYGYERKTTPVFDEFAKKSMLFEQATAPSTWSLPSHASLFTGNLPSSHNGHAETRWLDDKMPTIAQSMAKAGWETRCFTANPHITPSFGLTRGFGWSDNAWLMGAGARGFSFIYRLVDALGATAMDKGGALVVDNLRNWMDQRPDDAAPAFVFVNFLEAHFPFHQLPDKFRNLYTKQPLSELRKHGQMAFGAQMGRQLTEEEYNTIRQPILDLYDAGVVYTDYLFGQVLDIWRKRGTLEETVFIVLGDHGEHVGEHGAFGHLASLYQEDLWVPFLVYYPPLIKTGKRVKQEVSTMGAFATIFDLLNLKPLDTLQYASLLPAMDEENGAVFGRPVISERFEEKLLSSRFKPGTANGKGPLLSPWGRYRVYRSGRFKLARHFEKGKFSTYLFDLEADPGEMKDLAADPASEGYLKQMEEELKNWEILLKLPSLDGKPPPAAKKGDSKLSDQAREQLKALGYIGDE